MAESSNRDSGYHKNRQAGLGQRIFLTLIGLGIFAGLVYWGGFDSIDHLLTPSYPWLAAAVTAIGLMIFTFSMRWAVIVTALTESTAARSIPYFFYSLSSLALGNIIPFSASVLVGRAAALNRLESISLKKSAASVLLDKLFDGIFMLMFTWPFLLLLSGLLPLTAIAAVLVLQYIIVSVLLVTRYDLWLTLIRTVLRVSFMLLKKIPLLTNSRHLQDIEALNQLTEHKVLRREIVLKAYWLSSLGQILLVGRAWLVASAAGLTISPYAILAGIGLVQASMVVSFTPGAIGISEAAWFIALGGAGVDKDNIAIFIIAQRLLESGAVLFFWLATYLYRIFAK